MARWEELPGDLISAISQRLESYVDYVRFGAICSSWNSVIPKSPTHAFKQIPWLMLPFDDETEKHRSFYSILDDKVYHLELPETRGKCICGSSYGWLVTVEMSPALSLFNPLTKIQIALPPLDTFPDIECYCPDNVGGEYAIIHYSLGMTHHWSQADLQKVYIEKVVLSSPPHDDYLAIAIFGEFCRLAFCRRNDKKWTVAETSYYCFGDAIFYEDKIYALTKNRTLLVSDMTSFPKFALIPIQPPKILGKYLVGSSTGLMMVERMVEESEDGTYKTVGFKVYLLDSDSSTEMSKWSEIASLGDHVMFLGYNASILIPSADFPKLKGNCIYYTDDNMLYWKDDSGGFDIGIFDLGERRTKKFEELDLDSKLVWPPPMWVMPNP